jgi:hypothetical protein
LLTCSAEDLIVLKLFANRPKDVVDGESVALRQRGKLDWDVIAERLAPFAQVKGEPEIMATFSRLRRAASS